MVGEFGTRNGGENSFLAIASRLIEFGWEMHAAIPPASDFATALEEIGIHIHPWMVHETDGSRKSQASVRSELATAIKTIRPKILHFNSLSTSRIGGPVARELKVSSLGYLRDILKLSKKAVQDVNQVDRLISVSKATRNWHVAQGIDAEKSTVIYNGVDTDTFCPRPINPKFNSHQIRDEFSIPSDAEVLLFVGQIGMRKGVERLVNSFLDMAASRPILHLLIVGKRHSTKQEAIDYENKILASAHRSPFSNRIHWLGRRTDVPEIMRESTILVHPARQEPLGRVLLEAASTGLPIVTTRVGGSAEILNQPFDHLLTDPNDENEITTKLNEMLGQPKSLAELGLQLRSRAMDCFSIEKCASQIDGQYRKLGLAN